MIVKKLAKFMTHRRWAGYALHRSFLLWSYRARLYAKKIPARSSNWLSILSGVTFLLHRSFFLCSYRARLYNKNSFITKGSQPGYTPHRSFFLCSYRARLYAKKIPARSSIRLSILSKVTFFPPSISLGRSRFCKSFVQSVIRRSHITWIWIALCCNLNLTYV